MNPSEETLEFIRLHARADVKKLALQAQKYPRVDVQFAIRQIAGRQAIADKVPAWYACDGLLFPPHLSIEQCSSEWTAQYKAGLLAGDTLIDLTGGMGIDCSFLAQHFRQVDYVERNDELCLLASHNFPQLGLNHIRVHQIDASAFLEQTPPVDAIFIDPARRDKRGGKTVLISDCEPDVSQLQQLLLQKARRVMVKLSPMLDLSLALQALPQTQEVHILSIQNDCKELLLILGHEVPAAVSIHCVNLTKESQQHFSFTREEESDAQCSYATAPEEYLYEPNSAILKAGAYKSVGLHYGVKKLHPNSHLYTAANCITDFPGRTFRVINTFSLNKQALKEALNGITKANITVRNFPATVDELRKRLKLSDGGHLYLFATTLSDGQKALILCEKAR